MLNSMMKQMMVGKWENIQIYLETPLLGDAIASIIELKDESEMDSFLSGKQMSFLSETINGLDDFELISFLVIK